MTTPSLFSSQFLAILAQSSPPPRSWESWQVADSIRLVTFIGIFIAVVVVGGILLMYLRRHMFTRESAIDAPSSLMEELRRLKKTGVLSEAEYEATRRAATAGLRAAKPDPSATAVPKSPPRRPIKPLQMPDRVAKPGFDLTGAPLPKPNDE